MAISLDSIKKLSPRYKILIIVVFFLVIGYFYFFFFLQAGLEKKGTLETKLADLTKQVEEKEKAAAQLDKYIREVNALKVTYKVALTKLPDKREIPGLLNSIALAGRQVGIEFILFEPTKPPAPPPKPAESKPADKTAEQKAAQAKAPPVQEKFYEEIPVKVTVKGGYHNTALFFEQIAKLPRIVNIEDVSVGEAKEVPGKGLTLTTSCTIKTYMFLEKKDEQSKKPEEKAK